MATALATLCAIAQRLGVRPLLAAAMALALGAVGTVWAAATVAEVNPLHLLFCALLIHRALVWEADRRPRDLVLGGLLIGLSVGNHLLTLFVAPFVVVFVLWVGRRELIARPWLVLPPCSPGSSARRRLPVHPAGGRRVATPPLQPPEDLRRLLVARHGRAVPRPVRLPRREGPGIYVESLGALWAARRARDRVLPLLGLVGLGSSSSGGPPSG